MKYPLLDPQTYKNRIDELRERFFYFYRDDARSADSYAREIGLPPDTFRNFKDKKHVSSYKTCRLIEKWLIKMEEK